MNKINILQLLQYITIVNVLQLSIRV